MNSEKVKEIKKHFEERAKTGSCLLYKENDEHKVIYFADILTYINELESENERLRTENEQFFLVDFLRLTNTIAELEKENEILQGAKDRLTFSDKINLVNNAVEIKLKQFAERLKEKMSEGEYLGHKYKLAVFRDIDIDETLNEFLKGENNE